MRIALVFLILAACSSPGPVVTPGVVYVLPQDVEACADDPALPWCRAECDLRAPEWCP